MLKLTEKYDLNGHLFQSLITYLLVQHENIFTLSLERKQTINKSLKDVVMNDINVLYHLDVYKRQAIDSHLNCQTKTFYDDIFYMKAMFNRNYTKCYIYQDQHIVCLLYTSRCV